MRTVPALALVAALAVTGCRSLLPRDDDSTLTSIGKGLIWVPVMLAVVVADGSFEDDYGVSPVDVVTGDCDPPTWDDTRSRQQRDLARRETRGW